MEAALRLLLPRLLESVSFNVHPHQGKQDLLKKLPNRLHGYSNWLPDDWRILVVVDRDDDDCHELKQRLENHAAAAGLTTRTAARGGWYQLVNRLAIEELEAWYFGDWNAVMAAYPKAPAGIPKKAPYREPDAISQTWETFERVLRRAGYFQSGLRKREAARAVAAYWNPDVNTSHSFAVFRETIREMKDS